MADDIEIEFDAVKDAKNLAKHGVSLEDAQDFDWATARIEEDFRFVYGEKRFEATGWLGERVHVVVFCVRGDKTRVISVRKANEREVRVYANSN